MNMMNLRGSLDIAKRAVDRCLMRGKVKRECRKYKQNGYVFLFAVENEVIEKSQNPIPFEWNSPCLLGGHESEDETSKH